MSSSNGARQIEQGESLGVLSSSWKFHYNVQDNQFKSILNILKLFLCKEHAVVVHIGVICAREICAAQRQRGSTDIVIGIAVIIVEGVLIWGAGKWAVTRGSVAPAL